jgi:hypothetical protein
MPEKPVMHGRDHRPGGTDPIPGLTASGVQWADIIYNNTTFADTGSFTTTIPFLSSTFETSDSSVFAYGTNLGKGGIQVNTAGAYLVIGSAQGDCAAPAAGSILQVAVDLTLANDVITSPIGQFFATGGGDHNAYATWARLTHIGTSSDPVGEVVQLDVGQNSGGTASISCNLTILQLAGT